MTVYTSHQSRPYSCRLVEKRVIGRRETVKLVFHVLAAASILCGTAPTMTQNATRSIPTAVSRSYSGSELDVEESVYALAQALNPGSPLIT